jgi:hypothetical protein
VGFWRGCAGGADIFITARTTTSPSAQLGLADSFLNDFNKGIFIHELG